MALWSVELSTTMTVIVLVGASMLLALGAGLVFPGANAGAITPFPESPGLVSAATVTGVFLMAGVMAYLEGHPARVVPGAHRADSYNSVSAGDPGCRHPCKETRPPLNNRCQLLRVALPMQLRLPRLGMGTVV